MNELIVRQQMLIRASVGRVFQAFVDPAVTTRFWLTHSTGKLEPGADVKWEWRMYGAAAPVHVVEILENERILIEWGDDPNVSTVEWKFDARPNGTTMVAIANYGFVGERDQAVTHAIDSMGGFSLVLAGAKAYLEHGLELNLIADKAPDAHVTE